MENDLKNLNNEWLFSLNENISGLKAESVQDFLSNQAVWFSIMDNIQDGISILTPDFNVIYINKAMRDWYSLPEQHPNIKCYKLYHGSNTKCENCPALKSIETGNPHNSIVNYKNNNSIKGSMRIHTIAITNSNNEPVLLLEYIRDITFRKEMEKKLENLQNHFEILEQQNKFLQKSIAERDQQFNDMSRTIQDNIEQYVKPSLEILKKSVGETDVDMVSSVIDSVIFPITKKRESKLRNLTSRELQIASLIKEGYTSKQIADKLSVTKKAVDFHRLNIRKKLRLTNEDNLQLYLQYNL